ncbi:MAG: STN domain-containing protein [Planctomycetes bacterium]|nr:STN domain-containing protein [Planctomycetota bacterium]
MKRLAFAAAAIMIAAGVGIAEEEAVDWRGAISKSLENTLTINWRDKKAEEALAYVAKASGVTITVDSEVAPKLAAAKVDINVTQKPLKQVLGMILKAAGLRYTLRDGGILVSTQERLVAMILAPSEEEVAEAEPITEADAVVLAKDNDVEGDIPDLSNPYEAMGFEPWKKPVKEYRDPDTGVMQFPAPEVWVEARDKDNPRFKFQTQPAFLRPEYLWETVYSKDDEGKTAERELLGRLAQLLREHPEWSQEEVLKQLLLLSTLTK